MHYKDGTSVKLGDIAKHDNGSVGIIIGGQIGSDYCTTHFVAFKQAPDWGVGQGYIGALRNTEGKIIDRAAVAVVADGGAQTREMVKIGHVALGDVS